MDRHTFKAARIARKMSQGALAKAVRLTLSEISRIECGYRDIRADEAAALAAALGLVPVIQSAQVSEARPTAVIPPSVPLVSPPAMSMASATPPPPVVGTNLDDPSNFTELPDLRLLERGALSPIAHRELLVAALVRTTKVLHTSRVRAAVWREWRQFERNIQDALRPI